MTAAKPATPGMLISLRDNQLRFFIFAERETSAAYAAAAKALWVTKRGEVAYSGTSAQINLTSETILSE